MCGIAGIFHFKDAVDRGEVARLTDSLAHRGPDGRGLFFDRGLGLGHRRLAILDLRRQGRGPMPYEDSQPVVRGPRWLAAWKESRTDEREAARTPYRYWITFNGEIYNFLELRRELSALGYPFRTDTDTEVILAAYAHWGEDCLRRFNGMWAFALWDRVDRRLFLARDRFGIKPLYYRHDGRRIVFASELKAFLALDGFQPALNEALVPAMLDHPAAIEGTTDETLFAGVRRLPPGHVAVVAGNGDLWVRRWWDTRAHLPAVPPRYEDQVGQFRGLLLDAVRLRMRSDVPVGTCLSGGVDSSAIACAMAHLHREAGADLARTPSDWQRTFIADFPGTMLDERKYADAIVRHTGARPRVWTFDQDEAARHVIDSVWSMEEVYGGLAVPAWCLYRELRREGVTVSLDGHGGDELLGGYAWYLDWPLARANENLYRDFNAALLPAILRNFDRCSMAHGIEIRMPLMDWRLVTFAQALPIESKFGGGYTKRVLRDALAGLVPDEVRLRRFKMGFNSPLVEWFNGRLAPLVRRTVEHPLWLGSRHWDGPALRDRILAKTAAGAWAAEDWAETIQVWTRINFVLWQRLFIERDASLRDPSLP